MQHFSTELSKRYLEVPGEWQIARKKILVPGNLGNCYPRAETSRAVLVSVLSFLFGIIAGPEQPGKYRISGKKIFAKNIRPRDVRETSAMSKR